MRKTSRSRRAFLLPIIVVGFVAMLAQQAQAATPAVTAVSPTAATNTGSVTITFTGSNLNSGTAAKLTFIVGDPQNPTKSFTINGTSFVVISASTARANFNIANAAPGAWTATVMDTTGQGAGCVSCFTIAASGPSVSSTSPDNRGQGAANALVTVTGTNFAQGDDVSFSGANITVNSTTFLSATQVRADITIGSGAATGSRDVTVTHTDGQSAVCTACFTVNTKPTATIATPNSRGQGASNETVSITGTAFQSGATVSFSGTGITINSTSFVGPTQLTASVTVASNATVGPRDVIVNNPDAATAATCTACFTVNPKPAPTATNPSSRGQGASNVNIALTGASFSGTPAVTFSGSGVTVNTVVRNSASDMTVNVTIAAGASATARDITVLNPDNGSGSCAGCFTINAAPAVGSVVPGARAQGTSNQILTIAGTGFQANAVLGFSGTGVTVGTTTVVNATTINATVSIDPAAATGARNVTVTNPDGATPGVCAGCFSITPKPAPATTSPAAAGQGSAAQNIVISGTDYQSGATVAFSGAGITVNSVTFGNATTLTANITVDPTATVSQRNITVTNPDGGVGTCTNCFSINAAPTINSSGATNPASRGQGATNQNVAITGTGFVATPTVTFSGTGITVNSVTRNSATQLTANINVAPAAATGTRNVSVVNPDGGPGSCTACFTINIGPSPTSATPASGAEGNNQVTIAVNGTNFQSGAVVSFSGVGITVTNTVLNPHLPAGPATLDATINVADDAPVGKRSIIVLNADGGTNTCTDCFTITYAPPVVASAAPNNRGAGADHQNIVITGSNFQNTPIVAFPNPNPLFTSGITVNSVIVNSDLQITVNITVATDATPGARDISIANPGPTTSAICTSCFTVNAGPVATAANPANRGQGAQNQTITVSGTPPNNFVNGAVVSFSGTGVVVTTTTFVTGPPATLAANVSIAPTAATGARDVFATNPDGGLSRCAACFTVNAGPSITSVSPTTRAQGTTDQAITLNGANFGNTPTVAFSGTGITIKTSPTSTGSAVNFTIDVAAGAAPGARDVTITNLDAGTTTCVACFTVGAKPAVTLAAPNSRGQGAQNQIVVLTGTDFAGTPSVSISATVAVNGVTVNSVTRDSATQLTLNVAIDPNATIGTRNITVTQADGGVGSCSGCFAVNAGLTVNSATPSASPNSAGAQVITFAGNTSAGAFQSGATIKLSKNGQADIVGTNVILTDAQHIKATFNLVSAAPAAWDARVTNPDAGSAACVGCFTITGSQPSVGAANPTSRGQGASGVTVTITGTNFANGATAAFSGTGITVNSTAFVSTTQVTATITITSSAAMTARDVVVSNTDAQAGVCPGCFSVSARPLAAGIAPANRGQGATGQTLVITGSGFFGTPAVAFSGTGVTVNSVTRDSATQLTVNADVAIGAAPGFRDVSISNPDAGTGVCTGCFTIDAKPTATTATPNNRGQGASNQSIVVAGTGFLANPVVAVPGGGVTVNSVTRDSATQLTVNLSVDGASATGARDINVANPNGGAAGVCTGCFSVNPAPTATSATPNTRGQGAQNQTLVLAGTDFIATPTVSFSGTGVTVGTVVRDSALQLTVTVSISDTAASGARTITVQNPDASTPALCAGCFSVTGGPAATTATPSSRGQGATNQTIGLTGSGFSGSPVVSFGPGVIVNSVTVDNATHLTINIDVDGAAATGARSITVTNPDAGSAVCACFTINAKPVATAIAPSQLGQGATSTPVTITGTGFLSPVAVDAGSGITVASITVDSPTQISATFSVDPGATTGARNLVVTNPDGATPATCTDCLNIAQAPSVSGATPSVRGRGSNTQSITIAGGNFVATPTVSFSGGGIVVDTVARDSISQLTLSISIAPTATPGARNITVVNPDQGSASCTSCFAVTANPAITSLSPSSKNPGDLNQTIGVTGANFDASPTATMGDGITVNSLTRDSATHLTLNIDVASGAVIGGRTITVTNSDAGVGTCACFTVGNAPTVAFAAPTTLNGPVTATFSRDVEGVTSSNFVLRVTGTSTDLPATLACKTAAGSSGDCGSGPVRSATLTPTSVPGQHYTATIDPAGASTNVVDHGGASPVVITSISYRASTLEQQNSPAAIYQWRHIALAGTQGGTYTTEHAAGATARFRFTGASVTWYTLTGPDQGLAIVSIDGVAKGTFNQYATARHFATRTISGLSNAAHTFQIYVKNQRGATAGTGTYVSVDAFKVGSTVFTTPLVTYTWRPVLLAAASGGSYGTSDLANARVEFSFRGTGIDWYTAFGPDQGKVIVALDGTTLGTFDDYRSSVIIARRLIRGLSDSVHTLRITVAGSRNAAATGSFVSVDKFVVL